MAYIGRTPDIGNFEKQILTPDSVTTTFALTYAVGSANSLYVNYGGVPQEPQVAYSVSGGGQQIVFSEAPVTGTTLYIIYYGKQLTTPRAAGQETTKQTFAGDGSTVTFTLTDPPVVPAGIMVFVDGILQREGSGNNYVSSGSTITFTSAPDSSAEIDVYTLVKEKVSIDTVADGSITSTKLAAGAPTWNGAGETVIATASTGNSLRITNTGSGNSLLVEDSTNPDSTPFVVDATGNVGIGTTSPSTYSAYTKLSVLNGIAMATNTTDGGALVGATTTGTELAYLSMGRSYNLASTGEIALATSGAKAILFGTNNTERARIDSSGNLGIGGTTNSYGSQTTMTLSGTNVSRIDFRSNSTFTGTILSYQAVTEGLRLQTEAGYPITFYPAGTERMRIDASGNVFCGGNYTVAYPGSGNTTTGIFLESSGQLSVSRDNTVVARFNRNSTDGTLLSLSRQGSEIGTVSVSSGTVSYNAFAGSHWSQLSDGSKPDILRGTVLDSINELVQWPDEPTTERLCKVKVSDMAGSKKVYGVFMDWDNDWTATNDMYVTAVGAFICRVNASVTVQEGDLLESNGDGTARVQADDLIRSSTIGKVTCTEKTHQYDDGSYCVPTVLYCG